MVGRKRARRRAAVERLQDRRLDLDEAVVVQEARIAEMIRARVEEQPRASPRWRSGRARGGGSGSRRRCRPWWSSGGGRSDLASSRSAHAQRELAAAGAERDAVDAEQVAEVERTSRSKPSSPSSSTRAWSWIPPGAVLQVQERRSRVASRRRCGPATRWATSVSSPPARPSSPRARARSARRPRTRTGRLAPCGAARSLPSARSPRPSSGAQPSPPAATQLGSLARRAATAGS